MISNLYPPHLDVLVGTLLICTGLVMPMTQYLTIYIAGILMILAGTSLTFRAVLREDSTAKRLAYSSPGIVGVVLLLILFKGFLQSTII